MEQSQALEHCQVVGVISFIPFLWVAGSISDKEIVKQFGPLNLLEERDPDMSDKGIPYSAAHWRGPRLSGKGTTHTHRFASL